MVSCLRSIVLSLILIFHSTAAHYTICQLQNCDRWRITVIPLLTEEFNRLNVLKTLVQVMIQDCQWFLGDIELRFLTKNDEFIVVENFETQQSLDDRLNEFTYGVNESQSAYFLAVESAITEMPRAIPNYGRYIFIATDFARNNTASDMELLIIDRHLKIKGIQMRSLRLDTHGNIGDPNAVINIQAVRNVSSRFMRVSLVEANNILDTVKPCKPMTEAERIRNIQYERDFKFHFWLSNHSWDITIGFGLFVSAIIVAVAAILVHIINSKRKRAKEFLNNLHGIGSNFYQMNKTNA